MRLFVAVPIPAGPRDALDGALVPVREAHAGLRWTRAEGWHLTLAFLGEVEALGPVLDAVAPVARAHAPARLRLGAAGRFGGRVLWAAVDDDPPGALAAAAADLVAGLADRGVEVDARELTAHLTLARAGRRRVEERTVAATDAAIGGIAPQLVAWDAEVVEVWRSHLGGGPARYEVVASLPLSAGD